VQTSDCNSRPESELSEDNDNYYSETEFEPQYPPTEIKWLKPEEEVTEKETPTSLLGKRPKVNLDHSLEQCDALGKI